MRIGGLGAVGARLVQVVLRGFRAVIGLRPGTPLATKQRTRTHVARDHPFSDVWQSGNVRIFTVRLVIWTRDRASSIGHEPYWRFGVAAAAAWPLLLNLLLLLILPSLALTQGRAILWLSAFSLYNYLVFMSAYVTWTFIGNRAVLVDDLLLDLSERQAVAEWLDTWLDQRRQCALPVFGAVASLAFLGAIQERMFNQVPFGVATYAMAAWTSFLGGNVFYWLWVAPGLARRLHGCTRLDMRWPAPATTPAVRLLADGFGVAALFLFMGSISIVTLSLLVSRVELLIVTIVLAVLYIAAIVTIIRVTIVPFIHLYDMIRRHKAESLAHLALLLPPQEALRSRDRLDPEIVGVAELYRLVSDASNLPFSTAALIQYGAAVLGSVVAFVFTLLNGK